MKPDPQEIDFLKAKGYVFAAGSTGYRVAHVEAGFIGGAAVVTDAERRGNRLPRRTTNMLIRDMEDFYCAAVSVARDHYIANNGPKEIAQHPPSWYYKQVRKSHREERQNVDHQTAKCQSE